MLFISSKVLYNIRKFSSHRAPTAFFCHDHVLVAKSSDQSQVSSTRFRNWNTLKAVHLSRMSGEGMVDGSSWFDPFERDSDCLSFLNLFHSLFLSPLAGFFKYFFYLSLHCFWSQLTFSPDTPIFMYLLCTSTTYSVVCAVMWWIDASSLAKWLRVDGIVFG